MFSLASHLAQINAIPPLYAVIVENTFTSIPDMAKRLFQVSVLEYVPNWCYKNVVRSIVFLLQRSMFMFSIHHFQKFVILKCQSFFSPADKMN
jgi:hypothetical protein